MSKNPVEMALNILGYSTVLKRPVGTDLINEELEAHIKKVFLDIFTSAFQPPLLGEFQSCCLRGGLLDFFG